MRVDVLPKTVAPAAVLDKGKMMRALTKLAGLVGAVGLVALANPAMAAGPIQIDVGANTTGSHAWTATAKKVPLPNHGINFVVWHGSNPVQMGCDNATATGTINAGGSSSGLNVGSITGTTWGNSPTAACEGPGGIPMDVTQVGTWSLNVDLNPKPTHPIADNNLTGWVGNVEAHVESKIPGLCEFDVIGTADAIFKEKVLKDAGPPAVYAQELEIDETTATGNLTVVNVDGCFGEIEDGDPADFTGKYNITSPDGLINFRPVP